MRSVPEWVGKTDDSAVPPHVKLRIWEREKGICHISKRKIGRADKWDLDHGIALCNGGEHREYNLFPALRDKHKAKTAEDVAEKSWVYRKRVKDIGAAKPGRKIKSAGFPKGLVVTLPNGMSVRHHVECSCHRCKECREAANV